MWELRIFNAPLSNSEYRHLVSDIDLKLAADFVLKNQSRDGSYSSYEPTRAYNWMEKLNASSVFSEYQDFPSNTSILGIRTLTTACPLFL